MSKPMEGRPDNASRGLRAPSSIASGPPLATNPLQPHSLHRTNAVRRVDSGTLRRRRQDLSNARSSSPDQEPRRDFSFVNISREYNNGVQSGPNNHDPGRPNNSQPKTRTRMLPLPDALAVYVKRGMPADKIGRYLELNFYGKDKFLGQTVTNAVNSNKTYERIAIDVLKTMDFRDDDGNLIYEQMNPAETPMCRPNKPLQQQVNHEDGSSKSSIPYSNMPPLNEGVLTCKHPNTTGPDLICPKKPFARSAALDHGVMQRLVSQVEASEEDQGLSSAATTLDHRAGRRFVVEAEASQAQGNDEDEGTSPDSDEDDEEDSESDESGGIDPFEEYLGSDSDDWSDLVNDYFESNPQVLEAEEVVITKHQGPPRCVFHRTRNSSERVNATAAPAVQSLRRDLHNVGSSRAPRRDTPFLLSGQPSQLPHRPFYG